MCPKVEELPEESQPREKLMRSGRDALSDAELIAILLRTGVPGRNVIELSRDLIAKAGSLDLLAEMEFEQISYLAQNETMDNRGVNPPIKGLGSVKITSLLAAFELGARALKRRTVRFPINSADDVFDYLIGHTNRLTQEEIRILLLDTQHKLIRDVMITQGILNETLVHPREVLRHALITPGVFGFILVHNHPSGNPAPSRADDTTTKRIAEAAEILGIRFLDHIIMGKPTSDQDRNYYSYLRSGCMPQQQRKH